MEKTRVKKGEPYWFVDIDGRAWDRYERNEVMDSVLFDTDNYFHTKEEAERMCKKFLAVLKGADVIETPSEEEIETYKKTLEYPPTPGCDYMERVVTETSNYSYLHGFQLGINWLKSKIVK